MANRRVRSCGRAIGSLVLATGGLLLPVGAVSATPMPQATPVTAQVTAVLRDQAAQDRRLDNGQFIRSGNRTGRGELTINNNGGNDAVISLAANKKSTFSVYVRNGSTYTVKGIRDGTYEIFFTTGADWDSQARSFTRTRTLQRFDKTLSLATTRTATGLRWSEWTITIYPGINGNTSASEVNPKDFPAL